MGWIISKPSISPSPSLGFTFDLPPSTPTASTEIVVLPPEKPQDDGITEVIPNSLLVEDVHLPQITQEDNPKDETTKVVQQKLDKYYSSLPLAYPRFIWEPPDLVDPLRLFGTYFKKLLPTEDVDKEFAHFVARGPWTHLDGYLKPFDLVEEFKMTKTNMGKTLKLKLILTGLSSKLPLIPRFAYYTAEYGFTHAALQVGPWLIDWNTGELVIPRPLLSSHLHMVLDLESMVDLTEENLKQVCEVISFWNTNVKYNLFQGNQDNVTKSLSGNCHAFVDYFLNKFEGQYSRWRVDGPIDHLIDDIKRDPNNFEMKVHGHGSFKTHKALCDYFTANLTNNGTDPELLRVFKALDRKCRFENSEGESPAIYSSISVIPNVPSTTRNANGIMFNGGIFGGYEAYGDKEPSRVFDIIMLEDY